MRLVFWLNSMSLHQLPYIIELMNDNRVHTVDIIAGEVLSNAREQMGWDSHLSEECNDKLRSCNVYVNPNDETIGFLLSNRIDESVHLFSGIRAFSDVYKVFCASLKYNIKRGIITERPNTFAFGLANGKPLWMHKMRFWIQDMKYIPYIDYIFSIGEECADYYHSISTKWKVVPFAYCTTKTECQPEFKSDKVVKILYVGSLSLRKCVSLLLTASKGLVNFVVDIVGDGPKRDDLKKLVERWQLHNINYLGCQKNSDIPQIMAAHDVLVLPSIYDGWGAVVNEALMNGLYVICSDKCGAKALLRSNNLGLVFRKGDAKDLTRCLMYVKDHIEEIRNNKMTRRKWSEEHISGKAISKYMVDNLCGMNVTPPWRL